MFPIDPETLDYDAETVRIFDALTGMDILSLLPEIRLAGEEGGTLSEEGALFLDPGGEFKAGVKLVPCEGDAGTGLAATGSVRLKTGNISAGTSGFAMVAADQKLKRHREIDMVTTPAGLPVTMVRCSNCTGDLNAGARLILEALQLFGENTDQDTLYTKLYSIALKGDPDAGGLLSCNYYSGEGATDVNEGRLLFMRKADSRFTPANFMRAHLYSALSALSIGMNILREENVEIERIYGHSGFFKTPEAGRRILSAAIGVPVSVMESAVKEALMNGASRCVCLMEGRRGNA